MYVLTQYFLFSGIYMYLCTHSKCGRLSGWSSVGTQAMLGAAANLHLANLAELSRQVT